MNISFKVKCTYILAFMLLAIVSGTASYANDLLIILKAVHNAPKNIARVKAGSMWPTAPIVLGEWVINSPIPSNTGAAILIAVNRKTNKYCRERINKNPDQYEHKCSNVWRSLSRLLSKK